MKNLLLSILLLAFISTFAQEDKTINLTVSGQGSSIEEAKQNALRSAIEQAFGAFISSKTEIVNDIMIRDEIVSITNGNIKEYKILNESQLPDGRFGITLNALVSVNKLSSFVQSKGIAIEIKGGLFALNIKQQLLNEEGEIKAIAEMVGLLHEIMQTSFDYSIKSGEPKSIDSESKNWEIPIVVSAVANKNMDFCADYMFKTISALSLTDAEVETYKGLNKPIYTLEVIHNKNWGNFFLRNQSSINLIKVLTSNWKFYTGLFILQTGNVETYNQKQGEILEQIAIDNDNLTTTIRFQSSGKIIGKYSWSDKKTLSEIEQMTGYSVKPRGVISKFKNGGYLIYEKEDHGIVLAPNPIGWYQWNEASSKCNELKLNGYSDWRLPSKEELEYVYKNFFKLEIGNLEKGSYWTNQETSAEYGWAIYFGSNSDFMFSKEKGSYAKNMNCKVIAVRKF